MDHDPTECQLTGGKAIFDMEPLVAMWIDFVLGTNAALKLARIRLLEIPDHIDRFGDVMPPFTQLRPKRGLCWCRLEQAWRGAAAMFRVEAKVTEKLDWEYRMQSRDGTDAIRGALGLELWARPREKEPKR